MYNQTLSKVLTNEIKPHILDRKNKKKQWVYGYNKEHDIIVISKTGRISEVIEIQNLKIGLPLLEEKLDKTYKQWNREELPKELSKIKSVFEWNNYQTT